jgi:hypothetical protein
MKKADCLTLFVMAVLFVMTFTSTSNAQLVEAAPSDELEFGLSIEPVQQTYTDGDNITLFLDVQATS